MGQRKSLTGVCLVQNDGFHQTTYKSFPQAHSDLRQFYRDLAVARDHPSESRAQEIQTLTFGTEMTLSESCRAASFTLQMRKQAQREDAPKMAHSLVLPAQGSCPTSHQAIWEVDSATNVPSTLPRSDVSDRITMGQATSLPPGCPFVTALPVPPG